MSVITLFRFLLVLLNFSACATTLIFDPAGDTKDPGRRIGDTYERTATLYLARHIKDHIEELNKKTIVLFSRLPGEHKDPIEKMRFVQQCNPDIFIHFAVYQSTHIKPQIHFYYNAQNGQPVNSHTLLTPIAQAHTAYIPRSKELLDSIYTSLQIGTERICDLHRPIGIPCRLLNGISAPACIIEIGIKNTDDLEHCIAPLAESIFKVCTGSKS